MKKTKELTNEELLELYANQMVNQKFTKVTIKIEQEILKRMKKGEKAYEN